MYYLYVLQSLRESRKLYVGMTNEFRRRLREHLSGNVHTTKRMLPIKLIFFEGFVAKKDASRRERYFKTSKGKSSLKQIIRESIIKRV
jgi:predicted GIY-YIG superfamily endonuclease